MKDKRTGCTVIRFRISRLMKEMVGECFRGRKSPDDADIVDIVRGTMVEILLREQALANEWARCGRRDGFDQKSGRAAKDSNH